MSSGNQSELLLTLVMAGAFATMAVHNLFSYLANRNEKVSLIFCLWISTGLFHQVIDIRTFLLNQEIPYQLSIFQITELISSFLACLLMLHFAFDGGKTKITNYLTLAFILALIIYLILPDFRTQIFGAVKILSYGFRVYILYLIWKQKKPYYAYLMSGTLIYAFSIAFFGYGPLSIKSFFPVTAKIIVVTSYIISINLYSAYLSRLAALTSQKLIASNFATQNLKELDQLKTKFFANITHEFRTPLTLIQGPVNQLFEKNKDPDSHQLLTMIKGNAARLLKLINQLLDLASLDAREMKLNLKPLRLDVTLKAIVSQFSSLAISKNIQLEWQLLKQSHSVMADEEKLETIFINILSNAIKFTPAGGKVNASADFKNNQLEIEVRDNGRGIPPQKLPRIFDRFYQVEATDSSHSEGTGIGLALVKEYVELMKGIIHIESQVGSGTLIKVSLKLENALTVPEHEAEMIIEKNGMPEQTDQEANEERPLLLIVEDNDEIRAFIKTCLGVDYRYSEAGQGKAGLERARQQIPDLIISDLMMPEMDGIELCREIKKDSRTNHIPFIILTAKAAEKNKLEGLQTGANDYLTKPFNKAELLMKVQNLIALRINLQTNIRNGILAQATPVHAVSAEEQFILKARTFIESQLANEELSVEMLANEMNLSREQCYRKIIALTGLSPSLFIRKIRLQKAAQLIQSKWGTVSQVAYEVGFGNLSYFSKAFKEEFGKLPSEYQSSQVKA